MTEAEREEIIRLQNKVALLEGFINWHWGTPWRHWQEAADMSKHVRESVAGQPIGGGMTTKDYHAEVDP